MRNRDERHNDDGQHNQFKVLFDERDAAQAVAGQCHRRCPEHTTDHTPGDELSAAHACNAGDGGDEGAHNRCEPRHDNRHAPMPGEELIRFFHIAPLEELAVGALQEPCPHDLAEPVAGDVAENCACRERNDAEPQWSLDHPGGDEDANGEEQRVPGQEEADEQAAFDEDDDAGDDEGGRAGGIEQVLRVQVRQHRVRLQVAAPRALILRGSHSFTGAVFWSQNGHSTTSTNAP